MQGGDARRLGIPLVVANERGHSAHRRLEDANAGIAGGKVVLLVVEDVLGNVRLAIGADKRAIGVEDGGGVEESAIGRLLEEGAAHENDSMLPGRVGQHLSGRPGHRLGAIEGSAVVLTLTKIGAEKQFRQNHQAGPRPR